MQYQYQYRYPKTILCNANIGKNASDLALAIPISISVMRIKFLQYQYHLNMDKFCNNTTSISIFHSVTVLSHSPAAHSFCTRNVRFSNCYISRFRNHTAHSFFTPHCCLFLITSFQMLIIQCCAKMHIFT